MDKSVIEIRDEEIDVEEIMRKIRENIQNRKESGLLPDNPKKVSSSSSSFSCCNSTKILDLSYLTSNYDIQNNNYLISSHQPFIGKFLIKGRNLVHEEICRYIDPVIWKQTEFNQHSVCTIENINNKLKELDIVNNKLKELDIVNNKLKELDIVNNKLKELDIVNNKLKELDIVNNKLKELDIVNNKLKELESLLVELSADIENKAWLAQALEKRIGNTIAIQSNKNSSLIPTDKGINYFTFEARFRGPRAFIKNNQKAFLKYFEGCRNVLDIGCGRGEFLEIMKEQGIGARGVDLDKTMVDYCRMKGLEVELKDAISFLEGLEDASLDGIFIDQVVEHLEPDYLIRLLQLCHQKLQYGFFLVAETVNPLSFYSFANFYIDPTHVRPVHPETLRFLFDNARFRELEVNFLSPVTDEARLQKIVISEKMSDKEYDLEEVYNRNVELLNGILFGAQDYAVFGKK